MNKLQELFKDVCKISDEKEKEKQESIELEKIALNAIESSFRHIEAKLIQAAKNGERAASIEFTSDARTFKAVTVLFIKNGFKCNCVANSKGFVLILSW
jgi:hypothetical protein